MISSISFMLCMAAVALWVRSGRTTDTLGREWPSHLVRIISTRGHVIVWEQFVPEIEPGPWARHTLPTRRFNELCVRRPAVWSMAGASFERSTPNAALPGWRSRAVIVPYWITAVLFLLIPLTHARHALHRFSQRLRPGCCAVCGYDLRASKDRCPECGNAIVGYKRSA